VALAVAATAVTGSPAGPTIAATAESPVTGTTGVAAGEITASAAAASRPAGAHRTTAVVRGQPAGAATGRVRLDSGFLNVRRNASTWHDPVDRLLAGAVVAARCQLAGESIDGSVRTTSQWLQIGDVGYITDAYVDWAPRRPALPWCDPPADPAPRRQPAFIDWAGEHARAGWVQYQVPASVTVAQSINESGWGRSGLTVTGNSYFGIKCFGTPGPLAAGCRPYNTSECDDRGCFPTTATFRVYDSASDSFVDHGRFLTVNSRYRPAFAHTADPDRFAREIHRAGYATDPTYSDKLIALMREHDLYRFDR
jgi:flagellar protein FlgJ